MTTPIENPGTSISTSSSSTEAKQPSGASSQQTNSGPLPSESNLPPETPSEQPGTGFSRPEPKPTPATTSEQQFVGFFKDTIGFLTALTGAIPVLADYLQIIQPTQVGNSPHLLPIIAGFMSSVIFLALFWRRDFLIPRLGGFSLLLGPFSFLLGVSILIVQQIYFGPTVRMNFQDQLFFETCYIAFYLLSFTFLVAGGALVFLYGFVNSQERSNTMQAYLLSLDPDQWKRLVDQTRLIAEANDFIRNRSSKIRLGIQKVFEESVLEAHDNYIDTLTAAARGTFDPGKIQPREKLLLRFTEKIPHKGKFRAMSLNDLHYWSSPQSYKYWEMNKKMIKQQQLHFERIFVIDQSFLKHGTLSVPHKEAIQKQIEAGVDVYLCSKETAKRVADVVYDNDLDFGLIGDFAVGEWTNFAERAYRVSINQDTYKRYEEIYKNIQGEGELKLRAIPKGIADDAFNDLIKSAFRP